MKKTSRKGKRHNKQRQVRQNRPNYRKVRIRGKKTKEYEKIK